MLLHSASTCFCIRGKQQARFSLSDSAFSLRHKDLKEKSVVGKATDVALIKFVEKFTSAERLRDQYEIVYEVPFSAYRRYHLVITSDRRNRLADDDEVITYTLMVKGAPEELIRNCDTIVTENGAEDLTEDLLVEFEKAYLRFGEEGKSCLAFAMLEFDDFADTDFFWDAEEPNFPDSGWCFLGMAAMYDPPRPHINEAVRKSERAGIRLFMVTGDHPTTAEAVARQIGFCTPCKFPVLGPSSSASDVSSSTDSNSVETLGHAEAAQSEAGVPNIGTEELEVIHGDSLKHFTPAELERVVRRRHVVFARTTPAQKTELVKACQETRDIVTLTGDGLMDAPALKQADVGIAMEAIGSVFAKEASDIVILENDLANIVKGIEEARLLFDNLKKTIAYTLSHLLPEMLPVLLQFILGFPLGLSSLQVLTVDLITEIPPSIALIFEPAERDIMKRPPRKQQSRLVTPSLLAYSYVFAGNIISLGCLFAYFTVFWVHGFSISDLVHTAQHYWKEGAENLTSSSAEVFTDVEQVLIHQEASAAWHITLVMSQVLHLWMCTTRRVSLFRHGIRNWVLVAAVVFEVLVLVFLIFTPGLGHFLGVRPPPSIIWLFPFGVGLVLLIFNEIRKFFIRHDPRNPIVRLVKW
ncbi:Protein CATP-2 [Aphelenchoides avenae]|nr:Protein CATP-2 [Aphelenchus avenae]